MAKKTYAGIGSRDTPDNVLDYMRRLAVRLAQLGYTLRSGAAEGADTAFEAGVDQAYGEKEIWLPWKGFNSRTSSLFPTKDAYAMAETIHPNWENLSNGVKALHARNCHQILGAELNDPVAFCVCWTPDGAESEASRTAQTGGTGTAICIASRAGIPVFNLKNADSIQRINSFMTQSVPKREAPPAQSININKDPFVTECIDIFDAKVLSVTPLESKP